MVLTEEKRAALEDLHREPGKAELVCGRIVRFMPAGDRPGALALNIVILILDYVRATGRGRARGDNVGYAVHGLPSGRESFCPDVSYYDGPESDDEMDFIQGAPTFAVEVRSKDGYGPSAERELAAKRADYFAAGTKVVWDVDIRAECIHAYSIAMPNQKRTFRRGETADAEPALPGWRVDVDTIFKK
ncbi:MAG TPA: Uma2 family endonuclease [Planctomycetota bacterium]|nr:Uma2 family endonuclease [Planctomycetota bacterium]